MSPCEINLMLMHIKPRPGEIKAHNATNLSLSTTMRISRSLYISFDTVKSDFLSAKARLPESPVLTNTFTKLPRLAGILSDTLYVFFSLLGLYRRIMFCLLSFNLFGKWGLDTHTLRNPSLYEGVHLHSKSIWLSTGHKCRNKTGSMDSDKKRFAFTIDSILSGAFENTDRNKIPSLENALEAFREKSAMNHESVNQTDGGAHTCMNCCYCSHCGEILHTAPSKTALFHFSTQINVFGRNKLFNLYFLLVCFSFSKQT